MKKGILFDLDGTLWDSSANVIRAWNKCIAEQSDLGLVFTQDQMRSYMGKTLEQIADIMFPMLSGEDRMTLIRKCTAEEDAYLADHPSYIFPNEKETLEALHNDFFLAVVSNCQDGYIQLFLDQCGFKELFSDFECAGRTGLDKAGNIKLVAERNGLDKCVYVGDTVMDGEAARGAGVPFIHAGYGFGSPDDFDARITDITELPDAVRKLI
ncbi:MAG: HAD family hydrolase [Ruminiclostridium sp.]|nr:HAD family hydrolase [Ruminiclostridium sp.]